MRSILTTSTFLMVLTLFAITPPAAKASDIYVAQSAAGSANGTACANAYAYTFFNSSSNWGLGVNQIGPGTIVHLCGTITAALQAQGSGASGQPVTILFEPAAKISLTACGSTGCLNIAGRSYLVVDGGSNGLIQATNSGSGLGSTDSIGVYGRSGISHCEIKNLAISNMYIHSLASDNASGDYYAIWMDGSNNLIHNNTINDALGGIKVEGSSSSNQYYSNTIYNSNWGIFESAAHSTNSITNEQIYGNDIHDFANWDTTADTFHHDGIFLSGSSATTDLTNVLVYNNYLHGTSSNAVTCASASGSCMTAYIYINTDSSVSVFNNLLAPNVGDPGPNGGWLEMYADANDSIYNNTIIGSTTTGNTNCAYLADGTAYTFENNVISNCNMLVWALSSTFNSIDYNVYQRSSLNSSWRINSSYYSTIGTWRAAIVGEAHSQAQTGSLNLDASDKPLAGSVVIGAGVNLTSLGVTALDSDEVGNVRPATGAWDAGAYESASSPTPNPPSALAATAR